MKVKLLKPYRILCNPGDIVDVSPALYNNLTSLGAAEPVKGETVEAKPEVKKKRTTKK